MCPSTHRLLTIWAVCCIVAALLLAGFCFLDTVFAGQSLSDADPFPYARADAVQYGQTGFRYFYRGHLLTGPHVGYPVVLLALLVNLALLWLARGWGHRAGGTGLGKPGAAHVPGQRLGAGADAGPGLARVAGGAVVT